MEIGINVFGGIDSQNRVSLYKKYGVSRTFIESWLPDAQSLLDSFKENSIVCETLHAPFDGINAMWSLSSDGDAMLDRLKGAVDLCEKNSVPTVIIHVSSGKPMPTITKHGLSRYRYLVEYAVSKNVKPAFENQRFEENFSVLMSANPEAVFCWDTGHENCFTPGKHFMPSFGQRLGALHVHDNMCIPDSDDHLLPFDGKINMESVAKYIADSGYAGTLMLEVGKGHTANGKKIYDNMTDEEYIQSAVAKAKKLAAMVQSSARL